MDNPVARCLLMGVSFILYGLPFVAAKVVVAVVFAYQWTATSAQLGWSEGLGGRRE